MLLQQQAQKLTHQMHLYHLQSLNSEELQVVHQTSVMLVWLDMYLEAAAAVIQVVIKVHQQEVQGDSSNKSLLQSVK